MDTYLMFGNRRISYETFLDDVTHHLIKSLKQNGYIQNVCPEYLSQRAAYRLFGRGNVERWTRLGKIYPIKRPGKFGYPIEVLRELQKNEQDYLYQ
jgi:hypothetical protein